MIWLGILAALIILPFLLMIPKVHCGGSGSRAGFHLFFRVLGFKVKFDPASMTSQAELPQGKIASNVTNRRTWLYERISAEVKSRQRAANASPTQGNSRNRLPLLKLIIPKLFKLLKRLLASISADEIYVELIVATEDPMSTAVLYGALQPVTMFNSPRRTFRIGVDFERESPDFDLRWSFSARPIVWLWIFVTWTMTLPLLRIWRMTR